LRAVESVSQAHILVIQLSGRADQAKSGAISSPSSFGVTPAPPLDKPRRPCLRHGSDSRSGKMAQSCNDPPIWTEVLHPFVVGTAFRLGALRRAMADGAEENVMHCAPGQEQAR